MRQDTLDDKAGYISERTCPSCSASIRSWSTSHFSDCFPHFYCDQCSNVLWRRKDQQVLMKHVDDEAALARIAPTLPACSCGGRFSPTANVKCPHCGHEFGNRFTTVQRLRDPCLVLVEGATWYQDE